MFFRRTPVITPTEAADRAASGALQLVDVREPRELQSGGIPGATHIPLGRLAGSLPQLDPEKPVAFLCRSGHRSAVAARRARAAGFEAYSVQGGAIAWQRTELPLERSRRA